jgi:valyl-tRNA synthetase
MLNKTLADINDDFNKYRISEALMSIYKLVWDEFASWYLEIIKPPYGQPIDALTLAKAREHFSKLLRILHPFMPFITETLWQNSDSSENVPSVMISEWPVQEPFSPELIAEFEELKTTITAIRFCRSENKIPVRDQVTLLILNGGSVVLLNRHDIAAKLAGLASVESTHDKPAQAASVMVGTTSYFIPLSAEVNAEEQVKKLSEELDYNRGFLDSVMKKLANENFVKNAPAQVIENERKKQQDAETKIKMLEEQIKQLK